MEASQVDIVHQNSDKMTSEDVKSLIVFYRSNLILWNASRPQYRNHVAKNKLKEDLVNTLGRFSSFESPLSSSSNKSIASTINSFLDAML